jgi:hypothetical protein
MKQWASWVAAILRDERGLETLEWIFVGFVIIATIGVAVYAGGLQAAMASALAAITGAIGAP